MRAWLAMALLLPLAACHEPETSDPTILARIGDRTITVDEFQAELDRRADILIGGNGTREQQEALLAALVEHERLLATADALELDHDPEVQQAVERVLTAAVRRELEARSVAAAEVSDEEVADWYNANRAAYQRPERRQAALVHSRSSAAEDRVRLEGLRELAEAQETTHFGQLALDHSDDRSSRYRGGVVGWLSADRKERYKWPQPVVDAIFELEREGDVSPVIETDEGLFLARLVTLETAGARPLTELEDSIRAALRREKIQAARNRALEELTSGIEVVVHHERLEGIAAAESKTANRKPPATPGRSDS